MIVGDLPLLALRQAEREHFISRRTGRTPKVPIRDRAQQAAIVLAQLDHVAEQIAVTRDGQERTRTSALVTAVGPGLGDPLVARKLAPATSGNELLVSDEGRVTFRVTDDLEGLRAKAIAYAEEDTKEGNPRFKDPIARIEEVAMATISDLSLGEIANDIADDERRWVEIWTRGGSRLSPLEREAVDGAVAQFAALTVDGAGAIPVFRGPERDVHVVWASGASLKSLPVVLSDAAEVHLAPTVFPIVLAEAQDQAGDLADVDPPAEDGAVIAVHDSGIDSSHPYVSPILLGAGSVVPGVQGSVDVDGHGTQVAGVAAYSALADGVAGGLLHADAWLVAMRLLESATDAGGDPERGVMWAERTLESIDAAESLAGDRPVMHNLSIGADNPTIGKTDRTSWSVAADLAAWNGGHGRLLVVAGGNADTITDPADYPYLNLGSPRLQQPGQAWNVLTVGGYTALDVLTADDTSMGYPAPLASSGQLSPHSRTSPVVNSPIKPDIVMEAGNTAPGASLENPDAQGLSILTLRSTAGRSGSLLRRTYKTSPAAAAASNALAQIAAAHPTLTPSTWRALLVHTARWPEAAVAQFPDQRDLLRSFGFGVPRPELARASASNRPVMVYEGSLMPSRHVGSRSARQADFIEIPFPEDELHAIGESDVDLAVTLSYFVEPTDNLTRRAYAGGRLRWDIQGPTETSDGFRARINRIVHEQGVTPGTGSYQWAIPADARSRGTLQHDRATVPASQVAGTRLVAVYPVLGWWEDSREGWDKVLPYSLIVSVDLGDVDLDVYSLVSSALVPVTVEIRR